MYFYAIKILTTTLLVILVSEIAKKNTLMGALVASLPIISILSILWLYIDTNNTHQIQQLSINIFWLVLPSLVFFVALPFLLKSSLNFYLSLVIATGLTGITYLVILFIMK